MNRGDVKRLGFLLGLVLLFAGSFILIDPMAVEERNCGSALLRKKLEVQRYAERCDAKLDRRRWPGFTILGLGAVLVVRIGPRVLTEPD